MHNKKEMKTKEENIIVIKSYAFAVRCVNLYKYLCEELLKLLMTIVKTSKQ